MATDDEILRSLNMIQATLALAFASQIEEARTRVRGDAISASILDHSHEWIGSTDLQTAVSKETSKSTRSVRDRLHELSGSRLIEQRGSAAKPEYRATGLV